MLQPATDTPLARVVDASTPNPSLTGFRLLPNGFSSLDARVELTAAPVHSLDVQYYLIANDRTGSAVHCAASATRPCAACACVLLVDDLYTVGGDEMFRGLAAFEERRGPAFQSFLLRPASLATKYLASLATFERLNHRMHKSVHRRWRRRSDGRPQHRRRVLRSRPTSNFVDMDVLVVCGAMQRLRGIFDTY
jgi:putative cardiolipin synthase